MPDSAWLEASLRSTTGSKLVLRIGIVDAVVVAHVESDGAKSEDRSGDGRCGAGYAAEVILEEKLLAEFVKQLNFAAARLGGFGVAMLAIGEMADEKTGGEKGGESNPVAAVGDGEVADRRQEIEVVEQRAKQREIDRVCETPARSRNQHQHEKAECDGGLVDRKNGAKHDDQQRGGGGDDGATQQRLTRSRCMLLHDRRS